MMTLSLNSLKQLWLPSDVNLQLAKPVPIYTFLLKVASRCNIDCDYCYVYRLADQSWQLQPHFMADEIVEFCALRISNHVVTHDLEEIRVVFHGGEPLLAGAKRIFKIIELFQNRIPCKVLFGMQTNGTLIDDSTIELIEKYDIAVGISLDGHRSANDRHRRDFSGKSTYDRVLKGIEKLKSAASVTGKNLFSGILCVIDLTNEPLEIYRELLKFEPPNIDFTLPDCNHEHLPPGITIPYESHPYADWLIPIFHEWYTSQNTRTTVRFFKDIIGLILGAANSVETIGPGCVDLVVVETNGDIEAVDTLKVDFQGATSLGLNVCRNEFDEALSHPAVYSRMMGKEALCLTCRQCPIVDICGGGYVPHRYSRQNGFLNPSVYCLDLKHLIEHINETIGYDLPKKSVIKHEISGLYK
jgi:uncharacterized protein